MCWVVNVSWQSSTSPPKRDGEVCVGKRYGRLTAAIYTTSLPSTIWSWAMSWKKTGAMPIEPVSAVCLESCWVFRGMGSLVGWDGRARTPIWAVDLGDRDRYGKRPIVGDTLHVFAASTLPKRDHSEFVCVEASTGAVQWRPRVGAQPPEASQARTQAPCYRYDSAAEVQDDRDLL